MPEHNEISSARDIPNLRVTSPIVRDILLDVGRFDLAAASSITN